VSESGIHTRSDIETLRDAGFQAFLIGESLMRSPDPLELLKSLTSHAI
jgi:indole-3-glycerol phosphate synthase